MRRDKSRWIDIAAELLAPKQKWLGELCQLFADYHTTFIQNIKTAILRMSVCTRDCFRCFRSCGHQLLFFYTGKEQAELTASE